MELAVPEDISLLADLEARQDDVLRQLEELEGMVERAIADFTASKGSGDSTTSG